MTLFQLDIDGQCLTLSSAACDAVLHAMARAMDAPGKRANFKSHDGTRVSVLFLTDDSAGLPGSAKMIDRTRPTHYAAAGPARHEDGANLAKF